MQHTGQTGLGRMVARWGAGTMLAVSLLGGTLAGANAAQGTLTLPPTATPTEPLDITFPEPEPTSTPPIITNPDPEPTATAPDDITNPDPEPTPTAPDDLTNPEPEPTTPDGGGSGTSDPGVTGLPKTGTGVTRAREAEEEFGMPSILLASGMVISIAGIVVRGQHLRRGDR